MIVREQRFSSISHREAFYHLETEFKKVTKLKISNKVIVYYKIIILNNIYSLLAIIISVIRNYYALNDKLWK